MSRVALIRCESYEYPVLLEAIKKGISFLGGIGKYVKKDEKILLKINLLTGEVPEKSVCTNPYVVKAVGEIFSEAGADVSYGDSPGFGTTMNSLKRGGFIDICTNIKPAEFNEGKEILFENAVQNKKLFIARPVLENDGLISLPKLKTHGYQKYTGCIKNQFGCISGLSKAEYHVKLPDVNDFAKMLVDVDRFVRPRLYIMDGISAMEGNGPRSGNPRKMNVLLFSEDPVALDATACRLINLDPLLVPVIKAGAEAGHGEYKHEKIELVGDEFKSFVQDDFVVDRNTLKPFKKSGMVTFLSNRFVPRPAIDPEKCIKCGVCVNICPVKPKALSWEKGDKTKAPVYDYSLCIRCYCCQEMCPEKAISLKKPFLRKIFG
jgi:uncharacterized protein (DUF362 family)/ferredoxin